MQTVITNAKLLLEEEVIDGTVVIEDGLIADVSQGRSALASAIDAEGDYVSPGLVEMHTDNMERHFLPRPKVVWPDPLAAALAHDAQMAAAGVTTVYDAICVGTIDSGDKAYRRQIYGGMVDAVREGMAGGHFRIEHRIHLRCELSTDGVLADIEDVADEPLVRLASLMDHTPGQRQWRNVADLEAFVAGTGGKSGEAFRQDVARRMETGPQAFAANRDLVVALFRERDVPIATHDDTTEAHVAEALASGARISEFPTTLEAARAARQAGLATVAGAPNVVRGGSHSGGVAVADLAAEEVLDGLSSDYVPASLLAAVARLTRDLDIPLHRTIGLVTWRVADMLGLADRGRLAPGLRADMARFRFAGETPVLRGLWAGGARVM